jgi:predicted ABC-class ATPase
MTQTLTELQRTLQWMDGGSYGQYRRLVGKWELPAGELHVLRAQADPFAPPSRLAVHVTAGYAGLPADAYADPDRRRALADWLLRRVSRELRGAPFHVDRPGQEVLARSALELGPKGDVIFRLALELPGRGRRIDGRTASQLLTDRLPAAIARGLRWAEADAESAWTHVHTVEDACALRRMLPELGLVAWVGDGALLPRRSGVDERPLPSGAVPFQSPPTLVRTVELPHRGRVTGVGVPEGITLIVGGGFHGKSTLLRSIEHGVYDHVPGDGRELVVSRAEAVRIRAEDGRRVARVDISGFVGDLPSGAQTHDFSTENASGSTSQAANVVEAIEVGATALLIDEDTAATNLMVRDARMRELVAEGGEPLTPLVDVVRSLYRDHGVSTMLVMGGCGDYLDVADHVIAMDAYHARDVVDRAREVVAANPLVHLDDRPFPAVRARTLEAASIQPRPGGRLKLRPRGLDALAIGEDTVRIAALEQLVDASQVPGIGVAIARLAERGHLDGRPLADALDEWEEEVRRRGVGALAGGYSGDVALPRRFEVAAALDRLPSLRVRALA